MKNGAECQLNFGQKICDGAEINTFELYPHSREKILKTQQL